MPSLTEEDPAARRKEAEAWCDRFEANTAKWCKSTVASYENDQPVIRYEDVDTSLIKPRPRLYGLVGADVIEDVWKQRQQQHAQSNGSANPAEKSAPATTS